MVLRCKPRGLTCRASFFHSCELCLVFAALQHHVYSLQSNQQVRDTRDNIEGNRLRTRQHKVTHLSCICAQLQQL